jgi:hypothetical protein
MKRREFISLLGGAAASSVIAPPAAGDAGDRFSRPKFGGIRRLSREVVPVGFE